MTVFLRKQRAQAIIEGREPTEWREDDYAVVDGILFARIYKGRMPAGEKWRWCLIGLFVVVPPGVQSCGAADTLEQAKAEIVAQYRKQRWDGWGPALPAARMLWHPINVPASVAVKNMVGRLLAQPRQDRQ